MADPLSFKSERDLPGFHELLLGLGEEERREVSAPPRQPQPVLSVQLEQTQALFPHVHPQATFSPFSQQLQVLGNNPYSANVLSKWLNLTLMVDSPHHQIPLLAVPPVSEGGQQASSGAGSAWSSRDGPYDGPGAMAADVKAEPSTPATTCGAVETSKAKSSSPQKRFR